MKNVLFVAFFALTGCTYPTEYVCKGKEVEIVIRSGNWSFWGQVNAPKGVRYEGKIKTPKGIEDVDCFHYWVKP